MTNKKEKTNTSG